MRKYKGKRTPKIMSLGLYFLFIVIPQQEIQLQTSVCTGYKIFHTEKMQCVTEYSTVSPNSKAHTHFSCLNNPEVHTALQEYMVCTYTHICNSQLERGTSKKNMQPSPGSKPEAIILTCGV